MNFQEEFDLLIHDYSLGKISSEPIVSLMLNNVSNNKEYLKAILAKDTNVIPQDVLNSNIVLLEFKIVPLNSIVASITDDVVTDIFVEEIKGE